MAPTSADDERQLDRPAERLPGSAAREDGRDVLEVMATRRPIGTHRRGRCSVGKSRKSADVGEERHHRQVGAASNARAESRPRPRRDRLPVACSDAGADAVTSVGPGRALALREVDVPVGLDVVAGRRLLRPGSGPPACRSTLASPSSAAWSIVPSAIIFSWRTGRAKPFSHSFWASGVYRNSSHSRAAAGCGASLLMAW